MKTYDEELLLISKLYLELNDNGKFSEATLREYKTLIEENYEIASDLTKYEIMQPLNAAIKTNDIAKIESTIDLLHSVFGGFEKETLKKVLKIILQSRSNSIYEVEESVGHLNNITTNNIYIDVAVARMLLQFSLIKLDFANIALYSESLKELSPQFYEIQANIKWSVTDVEL